MKYRSKIRLISLIILYTLLGKGHGFILAQSDRYEIEPV